MNNWKDYYLGPSKIPCSELEVHGMGIVIKLDTSTGFWRLFYNELFINEGLATKDIDEAKCIALQIVSEKLAQIQFAIRELQNSENQ